MKSKKFVLFLMVVLSTTCTLAADVVINSFPYTESFEGISYPPEGWERNLNAGEPNLERMTNDPENPTAYDTPYGNNLVR